MNSAFLSISKGAYFLDFMQNKTKIDIDISKINRVFFCGIGGIGMSALARMFLARDAQVYGSDRSDSAILRELEKEGVKVFLRHSAENLPQNLDLFVHTTAISEDNEELTRAKEHGIETLTYPEILGVFSKNYKTIAVSGTHGKTTTTAMIAQILKSAGFDHSVVVGSILSEEGSNFIKGKSEWLVVEACEYKRAFLNLNPDILVITNIEEDHLDYYKNLEDIKSAFRALAEKVSEGGYIVCNKEQENALDVIQDASAQVLDYTEFREKVEKVKEQGAKWIGEHNVLNASAAVRASVLGAGVSEEKALEAILEYKGVWRRFEYKGKMENDARVYDDYAHHPSEVMATLEALSRNKKEGKVFAVFQPHLYSRTKKFLNEFAGSFKKSDEVLLLPIYAAREKADDSISSDDLRDKIVESGGNAKVFEDFKKSEKYLKENTKKGDTIITMGAGDIFKFAENLTIN